MHFTFNEFPNYTPKERKWKRAQAQSKDNPSTSLPVRLSSLFKPVLVGDAQNHSSTHGPAVAYKPLCRPIPCPHPHRPIFHPHQPIPYPRPHRPTSIDPSLVRTNPYLQTQIGALSSRSRRCWSSLSTPNTDRSLDLISTSFDLPLSFPQSLTLSSSPSLFHWVWNFKGFILIFISLKVYILQFSIINLFGIWENSWENVRN